MNDDDLFIWPDDFWCFRAEYVETFLRPSDYRVVAIRSPEWTALTEAGLRGKAFWPD